MLTDLTKDDLYDLYINKNKGIRSIAKLYNCSRSKIENLLIKYDIPTKDSNYTPTVSKEQLVELYINKLLSPKVIGDMLNCSKNAIVRAIKYYNLVQPNKYRHKRKSILTKEYLTKWYIEEELFCEQIANREDCPYSSTAVAKMIKYYGLDKLKHRHYKQMNIDKEDFELLNNKEGLEKYFKNLNSKITIYELCNKFNISKTRMRLYITQNNLWDHIDNQSSSYEKEINEIFKDIKLYKNKNAIYPMEIDLYNDKYKVGIEFNGNYWHTIDNKGRNYHQKKSLEAEKHNIFLYHIFQYEWDDCIIRNKIINQLKNIFQLNNYKIFARKCIIREISSIESFEFLKDNHLQGPDRASVKIGLFYNSDLVSVMTFCKPRFSKKYQWELSRYCCKANYNVIGGASKLFKYFIKKYNPYNIVSYSDIAKTRGDMYEKLGFKLDHIANPNYIWINEKTHQIKTRYQCQRYKLINEYPHFKEFSNMTETLIMTELGYKKIEDAGNKVWVYNTIDSF